MGENNRQVKQQQQQQQQQQCIYLKKYKVYNTLCPADSYNTKLNHVYTKHQTRICTM